jgi:hypothetical protein
MTCQQINHSVGAEAFQQFHPGEFSQPVSRMVADVCSRESISVNESAVVSRVFTKVLAHVLNDKYLLSAIVAEAVEDELYER